MYLAAKAISISTPIVNKSLIYSNTGYTIFKVKIYLRLKTTLFYYAMHSFEDELRLLKIKDKLFCTLRMLINQPPASLIFIIDMFNVLIRKYQEDSQFLKHIQNQLSMPTNDSVHNIMNALIACENFNLLNDLETYI